MARFRRAQRLRTAMKWSWPISVGNIIAASMGGQWMATKSNVEKNQRERSGASEFDTAWLA